jgi:hypothetical protein
VPERVFSKPSQIARDVQRFRQMTQDLLALTGVRPGEAVVKNKDKSQQQFLTMVTLPMVPAILASFSPNPKMTPPPMPSRYRVMAWTVDGDILVYEVVQLAVAGGGTKPLLQNVRGALDSEIDEWFPWLMRRITDFVMQRHQMSKAYLDWAIQNLENWGAIPSRLRPAGPSPLILN